MKLLIILRNIILMSIFLYVGGWMIGLGLPYDCYGPDCDGEVVCPDLYIMKIKEDLYIPCERLDEWIDTEDDSLLIRIKL